MTKSNKETILVVDDSPATLEVIQRNLASKGYYIFAALNVSEAIKILDESKVDLLITDYKMPKISGLDLIRHVKENLTDINIIMITGYATINGAVSAVKAGADEYLPKPFTDEELFSVVRRVLDKQRRKRTIREKQKTDRFEQFGLIGNSFPMQKVYNSIVKASKISATVLITGESGTGKELVTRAIHYSSSRHAAPFVPVNCGSIPENLLESELFGHIKGAFTGAIETRAGFFQTADGGTIFLDEISETSLAMQVKLLRVLQDKEVCLVGSSTQTKIDVRIAASTNKDLLELIKKEVFRKDLYFRLNVITIDIPPLRERGNDILLLVNHFVEKYSKEFGYSPLSFSENVLNNFSTYSWPGNVRELENIIQRLLVMSEGNEIDVHDLPSLMKFSVQQKTEPNRTLAEMEADYIRRVLESVNGNKSKAANILGIDRKTLRSKLKSNLIS